MPTIINKVVIHELIKEQHRPIRPSHLRSAVLQSTNEVVTKLVDGILSLYGKRNSAAHYGTFREDLGRGVFPDKFETYANTSSPGSDDFLNLTKVAMAELYKTAEQSMPSSGGYILFVDYSNQQNHYFLIAMIKQTEGITLSQQLEPEELQQLDLNRLYQAARISFGRMSSYLAASVDSRMDLSYLSFVSPKTSQTASGYFISALGCHSGVASSRATDTLIKESVAYFRANNELANHRKLFKRDLLTYLNENQKCNISAKLSDIGEIARHYMNETDEETIDEQVDQFIFHLNSEEYAVPVEFPVNRPALKRYTHIEHKTIDWEIKIDRRAISEDNSAAICYDRENKRIIINHIPDLMQSDIEEELESQIAETVN